jgi:4-amino-4-deoxy-L-arabinose transferase-like glycosyltransferase
MNLPRWATTHDREPAAALDGDAWSRRDWLLLLALLLIVFAAFQLRLSSVIISDMDEGTYVYAGQMIARGLVPYRDFLLAHPPLIALLAAGSSELFGPDLMSVRAAYLLIVLASTIPLFLLLRALPVTRPAALLALVTYTSGMLIVANMGRTVRLEPFANVFVIGAVALRMLRPSSPVAALAMGALIGCSIFVKAVAIVPLAMLGLADVLWDRPWRGWVKRWLIAACGAALVAVPAAIWCLSQPNFVRDVLLGQVLRPRLDLASRLTFLTQNLVRFPPILIGLIAGAYFVFRARDPRVRTLGLIAFGGSLTVFFAFKTFFNYYIVQTLPWIACCFALASEAIAFRWLGRARELLLYAGVIALGALAPLAYAEVYARKGSFHVAGPKQILDELRGEQGCLYSMYPAFGLWSGRPMCPWYYEADSLVPRINNWIGDRDFIRVFQGASALVLYTAELKDYPRADEYVQSHFRRTYADADWALWEREPAPH